MKRETTITAIVFFGVGFLAGYIFDAERRSTAPPTPAALASQLLPAQSNAETGAAQRGLPPGHPPVNDAALIRRLQDATAENPNDPKPALELANLYYDLKQFQQAAEWYGKALKIDPNNVDARTDLGTSYFNLGRPQDALRQFTEALKINPRHEPTLFNVIVVTLEGLHNPVAAEKAWERLQQVNPAYPGLDRLKQSLDAAKAASTGKPGAP